MRKIKGFGVSSRVLSFLLAVVMVAGVFGTVVLPEKAEAAITGAPDTGKKLIDNGDGTYTLALSVTGAAETTSTVKATKANVVLAVDTSSSMVDNTTTYKGETMTRLAAEIRVLTDEGGIIDKLLEQNVPGDPVKSDIIEIGIVNFDARGHTAQSFSTDAAALKETIQGLSTTSGTNWEEGLSFAKDMADTIKASQKDEDTYIIFLTDGEPTTHHNDYTVNTNYAQEWDYADDVARAIVEAGHKFYAIFTWGTGNRSHFLSSLVQYAYTGSGNSDSELASAYSQYFTNAENTDTLISALNQIVNEINEHAGYTNVEMTDGVTSMTTSSVKATASGEVTGLKYYRSGGDYSTTANGGLGEEWKDAPKATINDKGEVDWDLGSIILENNVTYTITFIVWPSQESYDLVADLNNGIVDYDSLTADQKAQINVSGGKYSLKTNKDYPTVTYSTVTTTSVNGGEPTVEISEPQTVTIKNPPPVGLAESKLNAVKVWDDSLDPSQREEIKDVVLYLLMDGDYYYVKDGEPVGVKLTEESDWTETDYISIAPGLMVTEDSPAYDASAPQVTWEGKTYAIIEPGHEYVFEESDINYHFELTAYRHHPMIMGSKNGEPVVKDVVFKRDSSGNITGIESAVEMGDNISATNTLKPGINIQKKVVDADGNEIDSADPFEVTVYLTDANGKTLPTKKTSDGKEFNYDYRIYYGKNNPAYESSGEKHRSDHIYGTGTTLTETLYVGDVIRVVNLEAGALFRVEESEIKGYELKDVKYEISRSSASDYKAYEESVTLSGETWYAVEGNSASQATLTNIYTYGDLEISKTVEVLKGDEEKAKAKEFTFTVKFYEDDTKAEELTGREYSYEIYENDTATGTTGKIASGGTIKLKDGQTAKITMLPEGAYYEVSETALKGFTVTKTGDTGTIVKGETAAAAFVNTYTVKPVIVDPPVKKVLSSESEDAELPDITGQFTFTIEGVSVKDSSGKELDIEIPMPENTSITNSEEFEKPAGSGLYEFGNITFTDPGVYTYTVTETGSVNGVVNDSTQDIIITVTDNGDGTLSFKVNYSDGVIFENEYTVTDVTVVKVWDDEGNEAKRPESVRMTLKGDGEEIETVELNEDNDWTYTWTDLPASTTQEDGSVKKIEYTVEEEAVAGYITESESEEDETSGKTTWTITNTYSEDILTLNLTATKTMEGKKLAKGEFEFVLEVDGEVAETVKNAEDGSIKFKTLTFDEAGEHTFRIYEVAGDNANVTYDETVYTGTISVTANEEGKLELKVTGNEGIAFKNSYTPDALTLDLTATKTLEGRELAEGEFEFVLEVDDTVVNTAKNDKDGNIVFQTLAFEEAGEHTFRIYETEGDDPNVVYDDTVYTGTISVTANDDGKLELTVTGNEGITFANIYSEDIQKLDLTATKVMEGRELAAGEFEFVLEVDDTVVNTVKNDKDGGIKFKTLAFTEAGEHTFKIYEVKGDEKNVTYDETVYTGTISVTKNEEGKLELTVTGNEDITFTNKYVDDIPDTSDHSNPALWMTLMLAAGFGAATLARSYRGTKKEF